MTAVRVLAVLLIAIEAAALSLHTEMVIPGLLTSVAVASLFLHFRLRISRRAGFWLAILGGLALQVMLTLFRDSASGASDSQPVRLVQDTGCYLLAVQAAMLWVWRPDDRPSVVLAGIGIMVMLCAGMQSMATWQEKLFRVLVISFIATAVTTFIASHAPQSRRAKPRAMWWRRSIVVVLLMILTFASWTTADAIDDWLDSFWITVFLKDSEYHSGFSASGDLSAVSSLRLELSDEVQLRVQSVTRPGYLRGQAFSQFDGYEWDSDSDYDSLNPLSHWPDTLPVSRNSGYLFGRQAAEAINWESFTCEPVQSSGWVFAPLGTTHVVASCKQVEIDEHNVFLTSELSEGQTYIALVPFDEGFAPLDRWQRKRLTQVPGVLVDELNELAATALAECVTAGEKIAATEHYFRTNYRYQLQQDWEMDQDEPMQYFLRERPPAHCEFFATGAALLLRTAGVPCRYVTGYVVVEPGNEPDHWLARGWHAHAWVEAYDEKRGWVIVEATPDTGVPGTDEYADAGSAESSRSWPRWTTAIPWTLVIASCTVIAVGAGLIFLIRKTRRRRAHREPRLEYQRDPMYSALHHLLRDMDRYVRHFHLERGSSETLHDFAWRIRQRVVDEPRLLAVAQWYPIYAACRYDGDVDEETIASLTQRLQVAQSERTRGKPPEQSRNLPRD